MSNNQEPIRVAQIVGKWVGGGVESIIMNYYRYIDRNKIQFDFILDSDSHDIPYDEIAKLGGKIFLCPPYQKLFRYNKVLKKILRRENYQIVHSHINALSIFPLRVAKKVGVPVRIAHSHSTTNKKERKKNMLKQILKPFSKVYATDYFACTEHSGRWLFGNKAFDSGNVYVLNNAIDLRKFTYSEELRRVKRSELNLSESQIVVGHVGRFVAQKNHLFIIDIFNEFYQTKSNAILLLVGQGPLMEKVKERVNNLGLTDCVRFLGQRNDVNELYQAFDFFLFPSLYEGLGMALVEAQCSGLKCFASTEVPRVASVNSNVEFVSLDSSAAEWAEKMIKVDFYDRTNCFEDCVKAGYNISQEAKKLESKYLSYIK